MDQRRLEVSVLVADSDLHVHETLADAFKAEGYRIFSAFDGEEALKTVRRTQLDAVVLDVLMPKKDGLQVCREIRRDSNLPILFLSAKNTEFDRLLGFEIGADDYITKPYSPREVVARIKAILRRVNGMSAPEKPSCVSIANLEIDMSAFQVRLGSVIIPCTPKEIEILWMLANNPGMMFSRENLLQSVWGYDYLGDTRAVDSHIKRIRAKLCRPENGWDIRTVWGVGYRFEILDEA